MLPGSVASRSPALPVCVLVVACGLLLASCGVLRLPEGPSVVQVPGDSFHDETRWRVEPSFAYDALCFFNYLGGDDYYLDLFEGESDARFARATRDALTPGERRAVDRTYRRLTRWFGSIPSLILTGVYDLSGAASLSEFRELIADPRRFRRDFASELDAYYRRGLDRWRPPAPIVDRMLRDVAIYLDALERVGFHEQWRRDVEPDLTDLADAVAAELDRYSVVPVAERLIGAPYESNEVRVHLARFARPNGISMGGTDFIMEERTDVENLARVALHELLHGWVDWRGDPDLARFVGSLGDDPFVRAAFEARNRDYGYNSYRALAEEGLVKALDQIGSQELGIAIAHRDRWFLHDEGMHVLALAFYTALTGAGYPGTAEAPLGPMLASLVRRAAVRADLVGPLWDATYGLARPGALPERVAITRAYVAGDPALDLIHASYNESMSTGMVVAFLDAWFTAESPGSSIGVLDRFARSSGPFVAEREDGSVVPLAYAFGGNWGVVRDGVDYFYRNALFFTPRGAAPEPGERIVVRAGR